MKRKLDEKRLKVGAVGALGAQYVQGMADLSPLVRRSIANRRKLPRFVPANFLEDIHAADYPRVHARLRHPDFAREEKDRSGVRVVNMYEGKDCDGARELCGDAGKNSA